MEVITKWEILYSLMELMFEWVVAAGFGFKYFIRKILDNFIREVCAIIVNKIKFFYEQ